MGAIPLVLATLLTVRVTLPSPFFVDPGFTLYPLLALFVSGIEVIGALLCLVGTRWRPFGAGVLMLLGLSVCAWQMLLYVLIRD